MSFVINRVYTRSGDDGQTALVGGDRVAKTHPRVAAYGAIDELNSAIGWVKEELTPHCEELRSVLEYIQQELFDLGSELASPAGTDYQGMWKTEAKHVEGLEKLCDHFSTGLAELPSFILPGGSKLAAAAHMARSVCRRAEREVISLRDSGEGQLNPDALKYVNRLSDFLFIVARWALEREGKEAPLWTKGSEREFPEL